MDLKSFLQKEDKAEEEAPLGAEKKIDFARKLPAEDLEGAPAKKGGNFDFLQGSEMIKNPEPKKAPEPRKAGEAAAVRIQEDRAAAEEKPVKAKAELGLDEEEKKPKGSWLGKFFKSKIGGGWSFGKNNYSSSRALEVNLVKGEIVKFFDWQKGILLLLVSVFASMAVLSLAYWGISWWGANQQSAQNNANLQKYYQISREIRDLNPQVQDALKFKAKLDLIDFLLARHIYWTNFFNFLEDNTLSNVYFSSFSGGLNGSYTLSATTDSLDAIDAQIKKLLANPNIRGAAVDAGSIGGVSGKPVVTFSLSFSLDPKIFLR